MSEVHFITKLWHTREVCFECALKYSFQDMLKKKNFCKVQETLILQQFIATGDHVFGKILILDLENTVWSFYQG